MKKRMLILLVLIFSIFSVLIANDSWDNPYTRPSPTGYRAKVNSPDGVLQMRDKPNGNSIITLRNGDVLIVEPKKELKMGAIRGYLDVQLIQVNMDG